MGRGYVERWVAVEEAGGLEPERDGVHRHHGPFLGARDVVDAEDVPEHDVGVLDRAVRRGPLRQPAVALALEDELAARPALVLMEGRHPEGVADRLHALHHRRAGDHHRREAAARDELVADWGPERV